MNGRHRTRLGGSLLVVVLATLTAACDSGGESTDTQAPPLQIATTTIAGPAYASTPPAGSSDPAASGDPAGTTAGPAGTTPADPAGAAAGTGAPTTGPAGTGSIDPATPASGPTPASPTPTTDPISTVPARPSVTPEVVMARLQPELDKAIDPEVLPDPYQGQPVDVLCPGNTQGPPVPTGALAYTYGRQVTAGIEENQGPVDQNIAWVGGYVFPGLSEARQFAGSLRSMLNACNNVTLAGDPTQSWTIGFEESTTQTINNLAPESFVANYAGTFTTGSTNYQRTIRVQIVVVENVVGIAKLQGPNGTNVTRDGQLIAGTVQQALVVATTAPNVVTQIIGEPPAVATDVDTATRVAGIFQEPLRTLPLGEPWQDSGQSNAAPQPSPITCGQQQAPAPPWPTAITPVTRLAPATISSRPTEERLFVAGLGFNTEAEAIAFIDQAQAAANCGQFVQAETPGRAGEAGSSTVEPAPAMDGTAGGIVVRQEVQSTLQGQTFTIKRVAFVYRAGRAVLYLQHDVPTTDPANVNPDIVINEVLTTGRLGLVLIEASRQN